MSMDSIRTAPSNYKVHIKDISIHYKSISQLSNVIIIFMVLEDEIFMQLIGSKLAFRNIRQLNTTNETIQK